MNSVRTLAGLPSDESESLSGGKLSAGHYGPHRLNRTTGLDRIKDECRRTVVRRHSSFSKALAINNPATTAAHNPKRASDRIAPTGERSPGTLPAQRNVTTGAAPTRSQSRRNHRLRTGIGSIVHLPSDTDMSHALHPVRLFRPYSPASNTVRAYRRGRSMKPFRTP